VIFSYACSTQSYLRSGLMHVSHKLGANRGGARAEHNHFLVSNLTACGGHVVFVELNYPLNLILLGVGLFARVACQKVPIPNTTNAYALCKDVVLALIFP
jgi:hypothetical protein